MSAEYVRTTGGTRIHRVGCKRLALTRTAVPWNWADGKSLDQLIKDYFGACGTDPGIRVAGCCFTLTEQGEWWRRVQGEA